MVTGGRVYCDALGAAVCVPDRPVRVVSLVSGITEAICAMGAGDRLVGVSAYCRRYVPDLDAPVVGDYLTVDHDALSSLRPDLILLTTGVQRGLARKLSAAGYPVYVLPLPSSIHGILENLMLVGGLLGEVSAARHLREFWLESLENTRTPEAGALLSPVPPRVPRVFAELWLGEHVRVPGGMSFITDMIAYAGGISIYRDEASAYMRLDPTDAGRRQPDVWVLFSEPEYPVDGAALARERGWDTSSNGLRLIEAGVEPHRNLIHDGPSMVKAVSWLAERITECA